MPSAVCAPSCRGRQLRAMQKQDSRHAARHRPGAADVRLLGSSGASSSEAAKETKDAVGPLQHFSSFMTAEALL